MVIFSSDFDALNWLPPGEADQSHVLRIVSGVRFSAFRRYLDPVDFRELKLLASNYIAVPEPVWQAFVNKVKSAGDTEVLGDIFGPLNPMVERPYYLKKGK
jgi:hypothetical protein